MCPPMRPEDKLTFISQKKILLMMKQQPKTKIFFRDWSPRSLDGPDRSKTWCLTKIHRLAKVTIVLSTRSTTGTRELPTWSCSTRDSRRRSSSRLSKFCSLPTVPILSNSRLLRRRSNSASRKLRITFNSSTLLVSHAAKSSKPSQETFPKSYPRFLTACVSFSN